MLHKLIPYEYKKWSTLLGGVLIHLALGSYYTFGNMSPYITSYLREYDEIDVRYSKSVWISTAHSLFMAAGTLLSGLLNSVFKINVKFTIFFESFLLTLITYGAMPGLGTGFAYIGPLSIAMKWFPNKKGLANSAILFGYGASAIFFDQVQTIYINPDNFSPDKAYSVKYPDEKYFSKLHTDLLERIPKVFIILAASYASLQIVGFSLLASYYTKEETITSINTEEEQVVNQTDAVQSSTDLNSLGVNYKSPNEGLTLAQAFRSPVYFILITIISTAFGASGFIVPFYKTFGLTFIENDKFLATVGSVCSIFNSTGRLFWGYLVDKLPFKVCYLILMTSIISLVSTIYLTKFIDSKEIYLVWVSTAKCFGQKNFTAIYGSTYVFDIPSSFLTAYLASFEEELGWFWLFFIGSCISLLGWIMGFVFYVKKSDGEDI
ncbi:unnamed protein product [Brachionus calyciflorus]|uniref:Uncharacterized protein n=1 Tax=Brachionus calyciflorus TaxID=104777 RepID=A0A814EAK2_9BILA|nr:unnamed protein product [Brachionus calyciflorus]